MPTILVVDDEEGIRQSTSMLLELLGYRPLTLADPSEVYETAREAQPGLILQDLRMPGLNVAGLVATLRSDPLTADIPIVFFSAHTDVATTANRYDVWGFLRKPFAPHALQHILDNVFHGSAAPPDEARKAVRGAFHDQWNIMAAMANYTRILKSQADGPLTEVAAAVEDLLVRLESSTDRLNAQVAAALDAVPAGSAPASDQEASDEGVRASRRARSTSPAAARRPPRPEVPASSSRIRP